jgi:hypothetical protein
MNICRSLLLSVLLPAALALGQAGPPGPATAPASDSLEQAIRASPDLSSAIEAYAQGVAGRLNATDVKRAFVHRMADFGVHELGDAQAHELITRGVTDATIRGVAAYNDAARGNAHAAITNLKLGLIDRPNDPFLLRTAGQVVAWYDSLADRSKLPKEDVAGIEWLGAVGNGRQDFDDAYRVTISVWRQAVVSDNTGSQRMGPQETPSSRTTAEPATVEQSQVSSGQANSVSYGSTSYTYGYPYYGSGYGYGYYGYGSGYYGYGTGNSIIVVRDRDFHDRRLIDHPRGMHDRRFHEGAGARGILPRDRSSLPNHRPPPVNTQTGPGRAPSRNPTGVRPSQGPGRPPHAPPRPLRPPGPPPGPPHP